MADVFDAKIVTVNVTQGAAYGAALLAGVGAQVFADVTEACARTIRVSDAHVPRAAAPAYAEYYPLYRALYPALAGQFKHTSAVVAGQAPA